MVRGRQISHPEAALRCGVCDGLEMERRGWEGSGPVFNQAEHQQMMSAFIPKKTGEPEHRTSPRTTRGVHVRVFHATLKRIGCGISPHTMLERES
jgi:hypothetical protein